MSDEIWNIFQRFGDQIAYGIGPNRFQRGRELQSVGVKAFVLDDGFQHLELARDLEVVLIDASNPFGNGMLLPAGILREPKSALSRADVVVITRTRHALALEAMLARYTKAPLYYAWPEIESMMEWHLGGLAPATIGWKAIPLFAFCALGNPAAFFSNLREWHPHIVGEKVFDDHHRYNPNDWKELKQLAQQSGAQGFVCTEKDLYNLQFTFIGDSEIEMSLPRIFVPRISMHVSNRAALMAQVEELFAAQASVR